ncbi:hypothetical protein D3C71_1601910 [compost metagenome]
MFRELASSRIGGLHHLHYCTSDCFGCIPVKGDTCLWVPIKSHVQQCWCFVSGIRRLRLKAPGNIVLRCPAIRSPLNKLFWDGHFISFAGNKIRVADFNRVLTEERSRDVVKRNIVFCDYNLITTVETDGFIKLHSDLCIKGNICSP